MKIIDDVISAACEELNVGYGENYLWFRVLIDQALKTMKNSKRFVNYTDQFTVEDGKVELPIGTARVFKVCKDGYCLFEEFKDYSIQNSLISFCDDIVSDGSTVTVTYKGLRRDSDGELWIEDDWERMLVAYIGWKFTRKHFEKYPAYIIQNYQREFITQKAASH